MGIVQITGMAHDGVFKEGETNCLKFFRMLYILLRFYFEFHDIMNHDMTGRALRKMVVRRIAAGIFTRRFFKIEPEVLRFNENLGPKRSKKINYTLYE